MIAPVKKTLTLTEQTLFYYDYGAGTKTLVVFPDLMGTYESWFPLLTELQQTHRIIILTYPAEKNLTKLIIFLHELLQTLDIKHFDLIASSLGGLFAQKYIRRYPEEVEKLLLISTGTADWFFGAITAALYTTGLVMPEFVMKYIVYLAALFSLSVEKKKQAKEQQYLKQHIWQVDSRENLLSWGKCVLALCWKNTFRPTDLAAWNKPLFLVESDNDFVFNPITRWHLRSVYPQATKFLLHGANHLSLINKPEELKKILHKFIES